MILVETYTGDDAKQRAVKDSMTGAGMTLSEWEIGEVAILEVWGSEFHEDDARWPGQDFCEWRAFDADRNLICKRRKLGY